MNPLPCIQVEIHTESGCRTHQVGDAYGAFTLPVLDLLEQLPAAPVRHQVRIKVLVEPAGFDAQLWGALLQRAVAHQASRLGQAIELVGLQIAPAESGLDEKRAALR